MTDFAYNPNHFAVTAGRKAALDIVNNGAVAHNFIVIKAGTSLSTEGHYEAGMTAKLVVVAE